MKIKDTINYTMKLSYKGQSAEIPLHLGSFYIGSNEKCLVQLDFEDPSEIYQFDVSANTLVLKSLNPLHVITVNGNTFTEIKVESSAVLNFSNVEVTVDFVQELSTGTVTGKTITLNNVNPGVVPPIPTKEEIPPVPSINPPEVNSVSVESNPFASAVEKYININGDVQEVHLAKLVAIDNMFCDIKFDDSQSKMLENPFDLDLNIDTDAYIDFEDKEIVPAIINKETANKSIEISWLHNGVLLSRQYFPVSIDKIFLSKDKESRKIFKASSLDLTGKFTILEKDSKTTEGVHLVNPLPNCVVTIWDEKLQSHQADGQKIHLVHDQSVVLTQGLNQIIIRLSYEPPTLEKPKFFVFDDQLIKYLAVGFAAVLLPFFLILLITKVPDRSLQKKEEVVVIYKKKLADATEKVTSTSQTSNEAQQPKAKTETDKLAKPDQPSKQEIPKKQESTPKSNKLATAAKNVTTQASKSVSQVKAPTNEQTKPVAKAYSFSASSQFKALLGTSSKTVAKEVSNAKSFVAEGSSGTTLAKSTTVGEIGKVNSAAKGFEGSEVGGVETGYGTSGLSGKSGVDTAYMESQTKVLGAIDPNLIRKILREYIPQFRYCYHQELRKDSSVAGVFDLEFKIDSNGKGRDVKILTKDKDFSKAGVSCIQNVISLIQFPQVKGGGFVEVVQPLNFQSTKR